MLRNIKFYGETTMEQWISLPKQSNIGLLFRSYYYELQKEMTYKSEKEYL